MKKLGLTALTLFGLAQATGCIIVDDDGFDGGKFHATWSLEQGGAPVACADVGAQDVSYLVTDSLGQGIDFLFTCSVGEGRTDALPLDDYTVVANILDDTEQSLGQSAPINDSLLVDGEIVDLPLVVFDFAPVGATVSFSVNYFEDGTTESTTNCGTNVADAQVTWQEVGLTGGDACTSYTIAFDGDPDQCGDAGTDTCTPCEGDYALCQEKDVVQSISGLADGNYTVSIKGYSDCGAGQAACYEGFENFNITGGVDSDLGELVFVLDTGADAKCAACKRSIGR